MKYPLQIKKAYTKNKKQEITTFSIEANLSLPEDETSTEEISTMPLEMHAGYSRFSVTIIQKSEQDKSYVYANIPAINDADSIIEKTRAATLLLLQNQSENHAEAAVPETQTHTAYTTKFRMGKWNGQTPAQVLLSGNGTEEELVNQINFLTSKLSIYPKNQELIDAINDALTLYHEGNLNTDVTPMPANSESSTIQIYKEEFKPLLSTLNKVQKDYCLIYGIKIACHLDRNYPYEITVWNCLGKISKRGTIESDSCTGRKEHSIRLTEKEWLGTIARMERTLHNFEMINFTNQYRKALGAEKENRLNAKGQAV